LQYLGREKRDKKRERAISRLASISLLEIARGEKVGMKRKPLIGWLKMSKRIKKKRGNHDSLKILSI